MHSQDWSRLIRLGGVIVPVWILVGVVFWRLFAQPDRPPSSDQIEQKYLSNGTATSTSIVSAIIGICGVSLLISFGLIAFTVCFWGSGNCVRLSAKSIYWPVTLIAIASLFALDAIGLIGAIYAHYRVVTGPQYLLIAGWITTVVGSNGLQPKKAWCV
jgi:hypothetical protein